MNKTIKYISLTLIILLLISGCSKSQTADLTPVPGSTSISADSDNSDISTDSGDSEITSVDFDKDGTENNAISEIKTSDTENEASNSGSSNAPEDSSFENIPNTSAEEPSSQNEILTEDEEPATKDENLSEENETPPSVTICMVGDILLHDGVEHCARREDGSYDYTRVFENVKEDIEFYDIAIVNQEVIIGGAELGITGYPSFNAPYEIGDYLLDTGFNVVCHATNHALDRSSKGLLNCITYWQENHPEMTILGIHDCQEDQDTLRIKEVNGIKIAILNYTYGTNGIPLPSNMPYAVDLLDENKVRNDIAHAQKIADFVLVCPHWGTEYRLTPDSYQEKWTKILFEAGADLVIGTHPHVIEPVEMITDEDNNHQMLVYYSLGNFVNWTSGRGENVANRLVGGMATITLSTDDNNNVYIQDYGVTALVTDLHKCTDGVTTYKLSDYNQEMADENEGKSQDPNFSLDYCINLCDEVWGDLWK